MIPSAIRKMAQDALEASGKATEGPWLTSMDPSTRRKTRIGTDLVRDSTTVSVLGDFYTEVDRSEDAAFIATARTSLPLLAAALLKLEPYIQHKDWCESQLDGMERKVTCTCGLTAALGTEGER